MPLVSECEHPRSEDETGADARWHARGRTDRIGNPERDAAEKCGRRIEVLAQHDRNPTDEEVCKRSAADGRHRRQDDDTVRSKAGLRADEGTRGGEGSESDGVAHEECVGVADANVFGGSSNQEDGEGNTDERDGHIPRGRQRGGRTINEYVTSGPATERSDHAEDGHAERVETGVGGL